MKSNRRWLKEEMTCYTYNIEMNQRHLLEFKFLLGKSEIVIYIPEYDDFFNENIEDME